MLPGVLVGHMLQHAPVTRASGSLKRKKVKSWNTPAWACYQATHKMSSTSNGTLKKINFSQRAMTIQLNPGHTKTQSMSGCASIRCAATSRLCGALISTRVATTWSLVVKTRPGSCGL